MVFLDEPLIKVFSTPHQSLGKCDCMHVVSILFQFMCENIHSAEPALVLYLVTWFGGFSSSVVTEARKQLSVFHL